jgi:hypothetical protein
MRYRCRDWREVSYREPWRSFVRNKVTTQKSKRREEGPVHGSKILLYYLHLTKFVFILLKFRYSYRYYLASTYI